MGAQNYDFAPKFSQNGVLHCVSKNRTPATFCNNSNSPGSIAIDFDKNNR